MIVDFYDNYARVVTKSSINMIQYKYSFALPRAVAGSLARDRDTRRAANPLVQTEVELGESDPPLVRLPTARRVGRLLPGSAS
jgi:hypothetical protein